MALALDPRDLAPVEGADELLLRTVPTDRLQTVDFHRLDLATDDVALEISAENLDLR